MVAIWKAVEPQEFSEFIDKFPQPLKTRVSLMTEPPQREFRVMTESALVLVAVQTLPESENERSKFKIREVTA